MLQYDLLCHNHLLQLLERRARTWGSGGMGAALQWAWERRAKQSSRDMQVRQAEGTQVSEQRHKVGHNFLGAVVVGVCCSRETSGTRTLALSPFFSPVSNLLVLILFIISPLSKFTGLSVFIYSKFL